MKYVRPKVVTIPCPKYNGKFKRQLDEEVQYFNSYVINLDSTCRLNK
jgi:hypothetical protein